MSDPIFGGMDLMGMIGGGMQMDPSMEGDPNMMQGQQPPQGANMFGFDLDSVMNPTQPPMPQQNEPWWKSFVQSGLAGMMGGAGAQSPGAAFQLGYHTVMSQRERERQQIIEMRKLEMLEKMQRVERVKKFQEALKLQREYEMMPLEYQIRKTTADAQHRNAMEQDGKNYVLRVKADEASIANKARELSEQARKGIGSTFSEYEWMDGGDGFIYGYEYDDTKLISPESVAALGGEVNGTVIQPGQPWDYVNDLIRNAHAEQLQEDRQTFERAEQEDSQRHAFALEATRSANTKAEHQYRVENPIPSQARNEVPVGDVPESLQLKISAAKSEAYQLQQQVRDLQRDPYMDAQDKEQQMAELTAQVANKNQAVQTFLQQAKQLEEVRRQYPINTMVNGKKVIGYTDLGEIRIDYGQGKIATVNPRTGQVVWDK